MRNGVIVNVEFVRAIDLLEFCKREESASFLHQLIRRLIEAGGARAEGFAPREGLQVKGWDGSSYSESPSEFVPLGHVNWELSSMQTGVQAKAERDFEHRLAEALPNQSYVAVLLGRWKGKLLWAEEKTARSRWATVRAYDVDDVVVWLESHPQVHEWATRSICGEKTTVALPSAYEVPLLPAALTPRPALEQAVLEAVRRGVIAAIWGGPGMGKSTLSRVIAHELRDDYPDGVFYASPGGPDQEHAECEAVQRRIIAALSSASTTGHLQADYQHAAAGRRVLVVFDNASTEEPMRLLAVEGVQCVSTSRRRLSGLESAQHVEAGFMTASEAASLLSRAGGDGPDSQPLAALAVAELCARIPLALHLAGSLASLNPGWGLAGVEHELKNRQGALASLSIGDRALRASFETAIAALPTHAAESFRSIAHIPGRVITMELLAVASRQEDGAARASLQLLREHGLITPAEAIGHYRVHDLLYEFIEHLKTEDPLPQARARQIAVVNKLITESAAHGTVLERNLEVLQLTQVPAEVSDALQWFDTFRNSLFIGLLYAADALKQYAVAYVALEAPTRYLLRAQRWAELVRNARAAQRWMDVEASEIPSESSEETRQLRLGWLLQEIEAEFQQNNLDRADELLTEALAPGNAAEGMYFHFIMALGALRVAQGRAHEGLECYQIAAELIADDPTSPLHSIAMYNVGVGYLRLNENEKALPYLERELATVRRSADRHSEGITLNTLGIAYSRLGRKDDARESLRASVAALRETPDRRELANATYDLACVLLELGEKQVALELFAEELATREELGDPASAARTLSTILVNESEALGAEIFLAEADKLLVLLRDDVYWQAALRIRCAQVMLTEERLDEAQTQLRESLELLEQDLEAFPRARLIAQLKEVLTAAGQADDLADSPEALRTAIQGLTRG